jgi:hypothetical protein
VALVSLPPHKFVRAPCWYYRLYEITKYNFRADPNGITSIPYVIDIRQAALGFNHAERETDMVSHIRVHVLHIVQLTHKDRFYVF